MALEGLADRAHDERKHGHLGTKHLGVFLALEVEVGDVRLVDDREVNRGLDRTVECFRDLATNTSEGNRFNHVAGVDRWKVRGNRDRLWCESATHGGRGRRVRGAALTESMDIGCRDPTAATASRDEVDVDSEFAGDATHRRSGECLAANLFRAGVPFDLAGETITDRQFTGDRTDHGAGVFAGGFFGRGFGRRGGCGHRSFGLRTTVAVSNQDRTDLDHVSGGTAEFADRAGPRTRDFDQSLVGLHLGQGLVFLDLISDGHPPFDEFGFIQPFSKVGKNEV